MKIYVTRMVRISLLGILTLLLFASVIGVVWNTFFVDRSVTEELAVYQYQQQAVVDYNVNLLPNGFFTETSLSSEQPAYLTALTDSIDAVLNYTFEGEKPLKYQGQYDIKGAIIAYTQFEREEEIVVWKKDLEYYPPINFSGQDSKISLSQTVNIPLNSYIQYVRLLEEATKFNPTRVELVVNYGIDLTGENEYGKINEQVNPTMVIPLKGSAFTVGGNLNESNEGAITVKETKPVENKMEDNYIYIGLGLFCLLLLGIIIVFTTNAPELSRQEKLLKELLRKHGERIVAFNKMPATTGDVINLDSFDDMVKIADEIEKPIFYYQDGLRDWVFTILDEPYVFQYQLEALDESSNFFDPDIDLKNDDKMATINPSDYKEV